MGPAHHDQDLVLAAPDGSPLRPEQVSRWFSALGRAIGVPAARLHDMRHLHLTLAQFGGGAPTRVLADRLGHSMAAVTSDSYQHVLPDLDRDAASKVAAFVFYEDAEPQADKCGT